MKKGIILLVLLGSLCTISNAQKNKDYILTLRKDTVFGKIKLNPEAPHITFTHNRKRVYFHPKTLEAFGIRSKSGAYKLYKSVKNARGESMFVEVLIEGKGLYNLYKYRKNEVIAHNRYKKELYYIGKDGGQLVTVTPASYERTMRVLVKDYPNLISKVESISYNEVPGLVASINQQ